METTTEVIQFLEAYMERVVPIFEQVMIFIDAGYLHSCLRDQFHRTDIDPNKFAFKLCRGRRLVRTYYYTAKIENPPLSSWRKWGKGKEHEYWAEQQSGQQRFLSSLAHKPFIEARLGRLQFMEGTPRQKGVDVLMAIDMLRFALRKNYDVAVLVSGDGDFADIVKMVKDEGRKVEAASFPGTQAYALLEACDLTIEVTDDLLTDCWETREQEVGNSAVQ